MPYKYRTVTLDKDKKRLARDIFAEYNKRKRALEMGMCSHNVKEVYKRLNDACDWALDNVLHGFCDKTRKDFIEAIAYQRGIRNSPLVMIMSPTAFYEMKHRICVALLKKLNYIEALKLL